MAPAALADQQGRGPHLSGRTGSGSFRWSQGWGWLSVPWSSLSLLRVGGHFPDTELLDEQQAVGVTPVLGDLAVGDAQDVGAGEGDLPADRVRGGAGEAAAVGAARPPPYDQVLVVGDRADVEDEGQVGQEGMDAADPVVERLAAVELVGSGPAQRGQVAGEVLGDDRVGDAEVAVPQVSPRFVERGVG